MKIFLLILYILCILAVIFFERKRPIEAILWVLVVICIPYVGMILYFVFGSTMAIKLTTRHRKKKLKEYYKDYKKLNTGKLTRELSMEDKEVIQFNYLYNHADLTSYDNIDIYTDGKSHYKQLFTDIDHAEESIFIEYYTIHNDLCGHGLIEALTKKALEGVKVLVLCDAVANLNVPSKMFKPLRKAGGKVIRIKPFMTHFRSHRKIVVIDHKVSYIGGMNIGKKYINMDKIKNPWRDTQVRLTGSCSKILEEYFLTDWLCSIKGKDWDQNIKYLDSLTQESNIINNNLCQFVVGGAETNDEAIKMCYLSMIRSAKKQIRIQTPYFIPDQSILDALKTAALSGVKVEIMIPIVKSSFFLDPVTTYYIGELLKCGVSVSKYYGYVHAKTLIIDEEILCVGSVNLSIRSLKVDDEICGMFYENSIVKRYNEIFTNDLKNTTAYKLEEFESRSSWEKFLESIFVLFSPLM